MYEEMLIAVLFVIFGFFEFFHPAEAGQGRAGRLRNIVYGAFVLTVGATSAAFLFSMLPFAIRQHSGFSLWQVLTYGAAYVVLSDFLYYWYHRAQHKYRALWTIHELHHSDKELNMLSSYRTYWLDFPVQTLLINAPVIYLLGFDSRGLFVAITIMTFFLIFSHANIRLHLGGMSRVLVGPQLHRIHHSQLSQHRDKNLAQVFPIFDIVFGTYYHPAPNEYPPTGTHTLASDTRFTDSFIRPFETWSRLVKPPRAPRP
ncbi:MAG: sterol desaturase family protein [Aliishimia sp.]